MHRSEVIVPPSHLRPSDLYWDIMGSDGTNWATDWGQDYMQPVNCLSDASSRLRAKCKWMFDWMKLSCALWKKSRASLPAGQPSKVRGRNDCRQARSALDVISPIHPLACRDIRTLSSAAFARSSI